MIAALFVETDGCYFGIDGVDPWDQARDARQYARVSQRGFTASRYPRHG